MKTQKSGIIAAILLGLVAICGADNAQAQSEDFSSAVTSRISEKTLGGFAQSNGASFNPRVSKNGRFVVFESTATNLVPDPVSNIDWDSSDSSRRRIYLYDRQANSLELVSLTSTYGDSPFTDIKADAYNPVVSNDGRYVAFTVAYSVSAPVSDIVSVGAECDACHLNVAHEGQHIYVRDRLANDTMMVSQIATKVRRQVIVDGEPQTAEDDACGNVPTMETTTKRISARIIADCTSQPPYNNSTNRCSSTAGRFERAHSDNARISSDGRYIVFDTDANSLSFLQEDAANKPGPLASGTNTNDWEFCCNGTTPGTCTTTGIVNSITNGNGNFLFEWPLYSAAYDDGEFYYDDGRTDRKIRDVYLRDGSDYTTTMVSQFCKYHEPGVKCDIDAVEDAVKPSISDDGSLVSFESKTPFLALDFNIGYSGGNLALPNAGDDVFVVQRSLINGEIANLTRVSNDTSRLAAGNGNSTSALVSADGRYVVYQSTATNLVPTDTNSVSDIFLFDRSFNRTLLCSKLASGVQLNAAASEPTVSGSGEYLAFESAATNTDYTGAFGAISQAYVAKVSKNSDGSVKDCAIQLASPASGQGANQSVVGSGIAVVPQTVVNGSTVSRIQRSSVVYESAATNLDPTVTDSNSATDIYQAPICTERDRTTDTDGDLTTDCFDQCYNDPIKVEDVDSDSDGSPDCEDGCKSDPQKNGPGACGCGVADIDSDGDTSFDCKDSCPNDPDKLVPGACGCGIPDTDANGNGTADCNDTTVPTPVATATPVASPTPVGTATPVPTATPDFTSTFQNLTPIKPSLSKGRKKGSLTLNVKTTNVPSAVDVTGFKAEFTCDEGGKTKKYLKNNTLGGVISGFKRGGSCSVKVTLRGSFAGKALLSKVSAASGKVRVP